MEIETLRNSEIERSILGNMINNLSILLEVKNRGIKSRDFYFSKHQSLYKNIIKLFEVNNSIDLITLLDYLNKNKLLEEVGGVSYVTELSTEVLVIYDVSVHVNILKEYSKKRQLLEIAKYINSNTNLESGDIEQGINVRLMEVLSNSEVQTVDGQAEEYLKILENRMMGEEKALNTGLFKLDSTIGGFANGDLITIFAFSGVGKTTLACQIALNIIKQKNKVLFFSLEMPKEQIRDRIISNLADVEYKKIKDGELDDGELNQVITCNDKLTRYKSLLVLEDNYLSDIIGKIQLEVMKNDIDIVFIDYINLINIQGSNREEHYKITECTRALKQLAKSIKKPIVILAQAKQTVADKNTNSGYRTYQKLNDNDIHGGASIFRDSDKVIGMYRNVELDQRAAREELEKEGRLDYNSKQAEVNPSCVNLLIRKCRSGNKGTSAFRWEPKYYRISNLE